MLRDRDDLIFSGFFWADLVEVVGLCKVLFCILILSFDIKSGIFMSNI